MGREYGAAWARATFAPQDVSPRMSAGVRDRVWAVMADWWGSLGNGSIVMIWRQKDAAGGLAIETLGEPPKEIVDADGILLVKRK